MVVCARVTVQCTRKQKRTVRYLCVHGLSHTHESRPVETLACNSACNLDSRVVARLTSLTQTNSRIDGPGYHKVPSALRTNQLADRNTRSTQEVEPPLPHLFGLGHTASHHPFRFQLLLIPLALLIELIQRSSLHLVLEVTAKCTGDAQDCQTRRKRAAC